MATTVRLARLLLRRSAINSFLTSPAGPLWREQARKGVRVQNLARIYVRVDTGTLRASIGIHQRVVDQSIVTNVGSNVEYAPFVGTRFGPHGNCVRCHGAYLTDALAAI